MKNYTMVFRAKTLSVRRQLKKEKNMLRSVELEARLERYYTARSNFITEVLRMQHDNESFDICTRLEDAWEKTQNVVMI